MGEGRRKVMANTAGVVRIAAARAQIGFVSVERARPRCRRVARGAAHHRAGLLRGLPEGEHVLAVGVLVIVSDTDTCLPLAALAVGGLQHPCAGALGAAIAETDAGGDVDEAVRRATSLQRETVG